MTNIHQISIFLENRVGSLSEITQALAESGVNLRAISIAESADYGVLRIIADDADKATQALLKRGCILSMTPVTVVAVPDEPSGLSQLLSVLAQGEIDIEYMYSLFTHHNGKAYMVFRIAREEAFLSLLAQKGLCPATGEELGLK